MHEEIQNELEAAVRRRDEVKEVLRRLEEKEPQNTYDIMITRDRLAYWQGKSEGLKFALDHLMQK